MELDVSIGKDSLSLDIENPYRLDIDGIMEKIVAFVEGKGAKLNGLDVEGLLPRMVKGIAGCEDGCPADAKTLVTKGHGTFAIEYIEGGILSARAPLSSDETLDLKMFPEF